MAKQHLLYILIIVIQCTDVISLVPDTFDSSESQTLHMFYIRHVESLWNEKRVLQRDSTVAKTGNIQLAQIFIRLGDKLLLDSPYSSYFVDLLSTLTHPIQIDTSVLVRAQLTAITVWKSLINTAKSNKKLTPLYQKLRHFTQFNVMQDLQEASAGIDAWSLFEAEMIDKKHCVGWMKYLQRGYGKIDLIWTKIFPKSKAFQLNLCRHGKYIKTASKSLWGHVGRSLFKKYDRIKDYGKWIRNRMNKNIKSIIVGGHSHWFMYFVDEFAVNQALKDRWGSKGKKIRNGQMVYVRITQHENTIVIEEIKDVFTIPT
eukprot:98540_1